MALIARLFEKPKIMDEARKKELARKIITKSYLTKEELDERREAAVNHSIYRKGLRNYFSKYKFI